MFRYKRLQGLCILLFFAAGLWVARAESPRDSFSLVVVHTNDFHGYDYELLARKSTLIRQIREENPRVLLLEGGDIFSRGKYHRRFWGELEMAVLNAMDYDAWVIGNNELACASSEDSTFYRVNRLVEQAEFPTLCCNLVQRNDSALLPGVKPFALINKEGVRIVVIGTTSVKARGYAQCRQKIVLDPLSEARRYLDEVVPQSDIRILLSHSGINADKVMGDSLGLVGLHAVVGADSHVPLFEPLMSESGIPIVQAGGENNQYLGVLRLLFIKQVAGEWMLKQCSGELLDISEDIAPDEATMQIVRRFESRQ